MVTPKILIIDDEPNILKSLKRILEEKYEVDTAHGGQQGLDLITKDPHRYDVIVSDYMMPEVTGEDLYNHIASKFPGLEKKIIFMTGGSYRVDIKDFFEANQNMFLLKPFEAQELLSLIEAIMSNKK